MTNQPTAETIAQARAGDRAARDAVTEACRPMVQRYHQAMLQDAATADDLTQATLTQMLTRLDQLNRPERLRSWAYTIAVHAARNHLREAWNRLRAPGGGDALEQKTHPGRRSVLSSLVRREALDALAVAIDRLPVLLREAFVLRMVEELSYEAMAEITGAKPGALQVRVHRARGLLARQLGEFDMPHGDNGA